MKKASAAKPTMIVPTQRHDGQCPFQGSSRPTSSDDELNGRASAARVAAAGISFDLTPEQRELRDLAHDFAERELRPIAREWDEREDCPPELLGKAAALGLTSHAIPAEYGGGGVAAVTSSPDRGGALVGLRGPLGADRRNDVPGAAAPPVRHGRAEGALAAPARVGGGLPRRDRVHRARRRLRRRRDPGDRAPDGDEYVLNGEKCYVTNGGIAELTIVFAKLDGAITAFLVEAGDPGVTAGRKEPKLGLRASYTGSILLDEARIPADRLLGEEGEGFAIAMDFFMHSRPQVAASALGIARAAFEYATEYANERRAFGKPLIAEAGRLLQARRHGDPGRGGAPARLARRRRRSTPARTRGSSAPTPRPSRPTRR